ncbi:MAG: T9SS type A sorting domain-containing protein [Maribacter sp.]
MKLKSQVLVLFLLVSSICFCQLPKSNPENEIKIFPNPATTVLNVLGLKNDNHASILISDRYGNAVINHQWDIKNHSLNIPVFKLEKGIYVITIQSEHQTVQTKFYKQ